MWQCPFRFRATSILQLLSLDRFNVLLDLRSNNSILLLLPKDDVVSRILAGGESRVCRMWLRLEKRRLLGSQKSDLRNDYSQAGALVFVPVVFHLGFESSAR